MTYYRVPKRLLKPVLFFAAGMWFLWPGRNVFGNPAMEDMEQSCRVPNTRAIVRMYTGSGGATTATWYSVTFEEGLLGRERQIFYTYSSPSITSVACHSEGVTVSTSGGTFNYSLEQIRSQLRREPVGFWRGRREKPSTQPLTVLCNVIGVSLLLGAALTSRTLLQRNVGARGR